MKNILADRLSLVEPSPTLAVTALANQLKSEGKDVVGFGAGEPDFDTPTGIKEAAKIALDQGFTKYTPVAGTHALRECVAERLRKDNGLNFTSKEIVIGVGGKQVLYNVFMALLNPGDEVVIPSPYWVSYKDMVLLAGGNAILVETNIDGGFKISPEQLDKAITPKTKIFLINSPCNPTGSTYSKEELIQLAEVLEKYPHVWILTDDIYEKLVYDNFSFNNLPMVAPGLLERTIIASGLSKAYSMTGWRIGYLACKNKDIVSGVEMIQGQSTSNAVSFAQRGAEFALREDQSSIAEMNKHFVERRDYLYSQLISLPGVRVEKPQGAFYLFPDFRGFSQSESFQKIRKKYPNEPSLSKVLTQVLLEEKLVAIVPGIAFGYDYGFRLSFAIPMEKCKKGMDRIAEIFHS